MTEVILCNSLITICTRHDVLFIEVCFLATFLKNSALICTSLNYKAVDGKNRELVTCAYGVYMGRVLHAV